MKLTELRIGNQVKWGMGTLEIDIDLFNEKDIDYAEPILLTKEWAQKFGYKDLVRMANEFCLRAVFHVELNAADLEDMAVHEAQNLFYEITRGEELTLNP